MEGIVINSGPSVTTVLIMTTTVCAFVGMAVVILIAVLNDIGKRNKK